MKSITLILPVYKNFRLLSDTGIVLAYPETEKTPAEIISSLKRFYDKNKDQPHITVISTSPYVMEGIVKLFKATLPDILYYSDGQKFVSDKEFWKHFAQPMQDLFFM